MRMHDVIRIRDPSAAGSSLRHPDFRMGAAAAKGGKPKATCAEAGGFAFAFVAIEPSVRERGRGAAPCETTRGETTMRVAAAAASARVGLQVDEPC